MHANLNIVLLNMDLSLFKGCVDSDELPHDDFVCSMHIQSANFKGAFVVIMAIICDVILPPLSYLCIPYVTSSKLFLKKCGDKW